MCNPIALAAGGLIMSAGTTAMQIKSNNDYAEALAEQADKAAALDYGLLAGQQQDIADQTAHEKLQRQLQTMREQGRIAVAQGEAGVAGNSALAELANATFQGAYDTSIIESNSRTKIADNIASQRKVASNLESRYLSARSYQTDPGTSALMIASSGASGATSGYTLGKAVGG